MLHSRHWAGIGMVVVVLALTACGGGGGSVAAERCASAGTQPKIFNGSQCGQPNRSPVVQLAMYQGESVYTCSGVMLTPTKVLSAAHCFPAGTQRVTALVHSDSGAVGEVSATSWVRHPEYVGEASNFLNDAAVVTLSAAMPNPSMPLLVSAPSREGDRVFIAGWGLPSTELAVGSAVLAGVSELQLLVDFNGQLSNTCSGDSGGPMYRAVGGRQGVMGLTSSGTTGACGEADYSLYTNTQAPSILNFIRAQAPGAAEI